VDKLNGSPVVKVQSIDSRCVYCQTTADIKDIFNEPSLFEQQRRAVVDHLGASAFVGRKNPHPNHMAPHFTWT